MNGGGTMSGIPRRPLVMRSCGGSTSGIGASVSSGLSHAVEKAPSARPISFPSCTMRPLTEVRVRPARSTVASTVIGPGLGGRRKCIVQDRGMRSGSATASSSPLSISAIT